MAGTEKQREEINRKLVSMQMEMIGLTYEDAVNTPEFWHVYTLTTEQTEAWRVEALKLIRKTFKCNKKRGLNILAWFELDLGLRICDDVPNPEIFRLESQIEEVKVVELSTWEKIKQFFKI